MSDPSTRDEDGQLAPRRPPHGGIMRSPGSGTIKAVSIAEPVDSISPMMRGDYKQIDDFDLDRSTPKKHRAKVASRLTGRASTDRLSRSSKQTSLTPLDPTPDLGYESTASTRPESINDHESIQSKVNAWIQKQKAQKAAKRAAKAAVKSLKGHTTGGFVEDHERRSSNASSADGLDELQNILNEFNLSDVSIARRPQSHLTKRIASARKLRRMSTAASSDAETDLDPIAPACDVILDNSKTLTYSGGEVEIENGLERRPSLIRATSTQQKDAWKTFKYEIVRLTHTLRLKGWRRVPMGMSSQIEVERLSGALTNAVYVVSPPLDLPTQATTDTVDGTVSSHPKFPPPKLLLRIYGSNVDQLIDRESELQILSRLGRKRIGPRLLGTFINGRFEEFFHARALTPEELRSPSVSKQIAKRMRELHDGIDLLPHERYDGPFVWLNIDKWMPRCEKIVSWLDKQTKNAPEGAKSRPLVCGADWSLFRATLEKYRTWLYQQYDSLDNIKRKLVFAHNDTQYGNILRLVPEGDSPLILPKNQHKQLIVIDFEYANANLVGLEFANHFSEWCYNYHDLNAPYACNTKLYPTLEEQKRFIRSYLTHQPFFASQTGPAITHSRQPSVPGTPSLPETPGLNATTASLSTSLISNFMLDGRYPRDVELADEEFDSQVENDVNQLVYESMIWRLANSAQWVMWGVMQAKIEGLPDFGDETQAAAVAAGTHGPTPATPTTPTPTSTKKLCDGKLASLTEDAELNSDPLQPEEQAMAIDIKGKRPDTAEEGDEDEGEEFDYLAYTFERAMFFWGDAVQLNMVDLEDLPEEVRGAVKVVEY